MFYPATNNNPDRIAFPEVVQLIAAAVRPEWIFFKGRCFFIVVPSSSQISFAQYKCSLDAMGLPADYHYSLSSTGEVEAYLSTGHFFYSGLYTSENLVYGAGSRPLPLSLYQRMELTRAQAVQVFLQGYHRACWFLKGAGYFIDNREYGLGAFLLHQSAEQCLRTLVLVVRGEEVKTHCLQELKQHLKKYAVSSHELFGEGGEREQHLWERLERAYSCSRYTGCYALEAATARELLQLVRRLLEGIKKMFWELLEKYSGNEVSLYK